MWLLTATEQNVRRRAAQLSSRAIFKITSSAQRIALYNLKQDEEFIESVALCPHVWFINTQLMLRHILYQFLFAFRVVEDLQKQIKSGAAEQNMSISCCLSIPV